MNTFIKSRLAPCGLHCGKCFAFADGDIRRDAENLRRSLGDFDAYALRFVGMLNEPRFRAYPDFREFLQLLTESSCRRCREEQCKLFRGCKVRACSEAHGVDFCFRCPEFPCRNTGFDEHLYVRHVAINERMREIGPEAYYEEVRDLPRYRK